MAFQIVEKPSRPGVKVLDEVRMACDATNATQILLLASFAKKHGFTKGSRVDVYVGNGQDKGWLLLKEAAKGQFVLNYSGGSEHMLSLKTKRIPFIGNFSPVKVDFSADQNGIRVSYPSPASLEKVRRDLGERKGHTETITSADVGEAPKHLVL